MAKRSDEEEEETMDEAPPNRLFIGHYVGDPEQWFLAWGKDLEEAALYVDCEKGEPDMDSMREVVGPGFIEFRAKLASLQADEEGVPDEFYPELEAAGSVSLGSGEGIEENDDWITERIQDPLGEPNEPTALAPMGVTLKRLADAYRSFDPDP